MINSIVPIGMALTQIQCTYTVTPSTAEMTAIKHKQHMPTQIAHTTDVAHITHAGHTHTTSVDKNTCHCTLPATSRCKYTLGCSKSSARGQELIFGIENVQMSASVHTIHILTQCFFNPMPNNAL